MQIRLRVEHSGYKTLPVQRFGSSFVDQLANPIDILLLWRRPVSRDAKQRSGGGVVVPRDLDLDRPPSSGVVVTDLISSEW